MKLTTTSVDEMARVAAAIAGVLQPGDLVVLAGELGVGKTVFVKAAARALGVTDTVVSPTFTILRSYEGRLPVHHLDCYRLDRLQELHDLGFDELVGDDAVTFVEWGDVVASLLPPDRLDVSLKYGVNPATRTIEVTPHGHSWRGREAAVSQALSASLTRLPPRPPTP